MGWQGNMIESRHRLTHATESDFSHRMPHTELLAWAEALRRRLPRLLVGNGALFLLHDEWLSEGRKWVSNDSNDPSVQIRSPRGCCAAARSGGASPHLHRYYLRLVGDSDLANILES